MNHQKIVLVDMDGVLADFDGATSTYLAEYYPNIPLIAQRKHFYYRGDYSDSKHQELINDLHASRNFFRQLPVIDGALEGWGKIRELGYYPVICSSPLHTNEWCKDEKLEWIKRYLGTAAAKEAIIDSAKETFDGIALIDDRPIIKNADAASWQHILFDQSYNRDITTNFRLHGWEDINLKELLARAEQRYLMRAAK